MWRLCLSRLTPSCPVHTSNIYPKKWRDDVDTYLFSFLLEEYFLAVSTHSSEF